MMGFRKSRAKDAKDAKLSRAEKICRETRLV